jgi:hypothetical protein
MRRVHNKACTFKDGFVWQVCVFSRKLHHRKPDIETLLEKTIRFGSRLPQQDNKAPWPALLRRKCDQICRQGNENWLAGGDETGNLYVIVSAL